MSKFLIVGMIGAGKSSTGNTLIGANAFTRGLDLNAITRQCSHAISKDQSMLIIDTPGFGDLRDRNLFLTALKNYETQIQNLLPLNGLLLVVKFIGNKSESFERSVEYFIEAFESSSLKSLMLICIQAGVKYDDEQFKGILFNSNGYKYLKSKNNGQDIQYCLWDNLEPYAEQIQSFNERIKYLTQIDRPALGSMSCSVENQLRKQSSLVYQLENSNSLFIYAFLILIIGVLAFLFY